MMQDVTVEYVALLILLIGLIYPKNKISFKQLRCDLKTHNQLIAI